MERRAQPDSTGGRQRRVQSKLTSTGSAAAESADAVSAEAEYTRDQLYVQAAALGINGRSRMTKAALTEAIAAQRRESGTGRGRSRS